MTEPPDALPALVEIEFEQSRRGLRSQLSQPVGDSSVLATTLAALARCRRISEIYLMVREPDVNRLRQLLADLTIDRPLNLWTHSEPDLPVRNRLRRGRKWGGTGWRGGLGESYFFCEALNPRLLADFFEQQEAEAVCVVPAEAVCLRPELVDEIAREYLEERRGSQVLLSTAPPGLSADIAGRSLAERFRAIDFVGSLEALFPFEVGAATKDPGLHRIDYAYTRQLTESRHRLLADGDTTRDQLGRRLRELNEAPSAEDCIERVNSDPDWVAGPGPEETIVELTRAGGTRADHRRPRFDRETLANEIWDRILEIPDLRDDALLTLGGGYGEPRDDPELLTRIRQARAAGFFGVHLRTAGSGLGLDEARQLLALVDVVSLDLVTPVADFARDPEAWESRRAGLAALTQARRELDDPGFVVVNLCFEEQTQNLVEPFFDEW